MSIENSEVSSSNTSELFVYILVKALH